MSLAFSSKHLCAHVQPQRAACTSVDSQLCKAVITDFSFKPNEAQQKELSLFNSLLFYKTIITSNNSPHKFSTFAYVSVHNLIYCKNSSCPSSTSTVTFSTFTLLHLCFSPGQVNTSLKVKFMKQTLKNKSHFTCRCVTSKNNVSVNFSD